MLGVRTTLYCKTPYYFSRGETSERTKFIFCKMALCISAHNNTRVVVFIGVLLVSSVLQNDFSRR